MSRGHNLILIQTLLYQILFDTCAKSNQRNGKISARFPAVLLGGCAQIVSPLNPYKFQFRHTNSM